MARNFGELVLAMLAGCVIACGEDPAGSPSDTDVGSGSDGSTMGPGPGPGDDADDADDTADDADSTGGSAVCGDGVVDEGEVCDDGPDNGTLGHCDANCQGSAVCGDGVVQREAGEVCDDGEANGAYGSCAADCSGVGARCGDGIVQEEQEACDDRNEVDGDGCNAGCEAGGQEVAVWTWGDPIDAEAARAVGVLPDGRFYVAGWAEEEGVPMIAAFEGDGDDPFYEYSPYHSGGGLTSASTMPDGRVLVTGNGFNAISQQTAIRLFIDLDSGEVTNAHIVDAGYGVRSVPLPGGGHILCNSAQFLGLQYFAAGDPDNPVWEDSVNDCHQVTVDAARVVKARTDYSPGYTPVVLTSLQHSGFLDWETEFSQGTGSHDVGGIAIDSAGNVLVAGTFEAEDNPEVELRPLLRKYDPDGEFVWSTNALFQSVSEWYDVTLDALDNVVVVGYHRITIEQGGDEIEVARAVVRKYDAAGDLLWSWQDDDPSAAWRSELESVVMAPDGTILATGFRQILGEDEDVLFVRLTP